MFFRKAERVTACTSPVRRHRLRAFTLVELMIVVAIIGILAALAMYGVKTYLANAKTAEAKQHVGTMSRGATASYERTYAAAENRADGTLSAAEDHQLCDTAVSVPLVPPQGVKYQPRTTSPFDFQSGDETTGWACLRFDVSSPIHYQYSYTRNSSPTAPANPALCSANCYEAAAAGDLNGDGVALSRIARTGHINPATRTLKAASFLHVFQEDE